MPRIYHKNCEMCGIFYIKAARRFCSMKCTKEYAKLHPNKGCFSKGHTMNLKPTIFKNCVNCEKLFEVSKQNPSTKYCCHQCSVDHLLKGKPKSLEHKINIAKNNARYWASHEMTTDHIKSMTKGLSKFQSGENHWNWKGGITPKLKSFRFKKWYTEWRNSVYERDNYTCVECGVRGGKLSAHHKIRFAELISRNDLKELKNVDNGVTLCIDCHVKTDSYAKRFA